MSPSNTKPKRQRAPGKDVAVQSAPATAVAQPGTLLTPVQQADAFMVFLERAAADPAIDVGKMKEILGMKKEVLIEQRIASFNRDFMAARMEMPRVKKDGNLEYPVDKTKPDGPKRKISGYAKYETIDKAIRPVEIYHGFSRSFSTAPRQGEGGGIIVTCHLLHKDGHHIEAAIPVPLDTSGGKNNLQGYGSSFSYGKRYTTTMVWDIITDGEDDDGNAAFAEAPIDDAQFKAFQELIEENGVDVAKFCAFLKVESLRAIPNKLYPKAMADLKANIAKRKEKEAAAKQGGQE